ncbi:MAG: hypothetical protein ACLPY5_09860 [Candidatus Bathyarchaeia archaeon]
MPIKNPTGPDEYRPTGGETRIAEGLRQAAQGLGYSQIRELTGLSDTALSKFIMRMQRYHLITRDETRKYHLTGLGLRFLMSQNPEHITIDDLKAQRKKDLQRLWDKVRRLHEEVFNIIHLPYADEASKIFWEASGGSLGLFYIGALKDKAGKEILSITTPDIEELERLGYTWK